ncbi:hypothetical protein RIF29_33862 [Crotalaria pallida]|uniref:Uncharacterized protein n=1 Tax=Crotalaria pallida TaxID=3830 RepID=A0AAN9EE29_CROPI
MFLRTCPRSRLAGQIGEATSENEDCDPITWLSLSAHIWPNTSQIEEYTSAKPYWAEQAHKAPQHNFPYKYRHAIGAKSDPDEVEEDSSEGSTPVEYSDADVWKYDPEEVLAAASSDEDQ